MTDQKNSKDEVYWKRFMFLVTTFILLVLIAILVFTILKYFEEDTVNNIGETRIELYEKDFPYVVPDSENIQKISYVIHMTSSSQKIIELPTIQTSNEGTILTFLYNVDVGSVLFTSKTGNSVGSGSDVKLGVKYQNVSFNSVDGNWFVEN